MPRVRVAILSLVAIAALAACAGSISATPGFTILPMSARPSAPATAAPVASGAAVSASAVASVAAVSAAPPGAASISLSEWKVVVPSALRSGKTTFTITNAGAAPHELLVFKSDLDPSAYPTDAAGGIKEDGAGIKLVSDGENIDPAGSQTRAIDLPPGKYLFVCNIPGHFKQGMFTAVTVAAP